MLGGLSGEFTFAVLGDVRAGDPACDAVYGKLIGMVLGRKPDLVMNTGDQIDRPGSLEHWKRFWELSKAVGVPYFQTVGNHDAHPNVPGSELYYSFVAGNSLFIVLDSCEDGKEKKITGEQYAWLEQVLAGSTQRHRFVFLHHPLYTDKGRGKHAGSSLDRFPEDRDRL